MKLLGWSTATLAYLHSLLLVLQVYNRVLGRVWLVVYIRMYKTVYVQVLLVCYLCQAILELVCQLMGVYPSELRTNEILD